MDRHGEYVSRAVLPDVQQQGVGGLVWIRRRHISIVAKDTRKDWTPAPEGLHQAVCVDVIDLGMVQTQWGEKHKVRLVWQIDEINPDTGKRHEVRADFGLSLSEKS